MKKMFLGTVFLIFLMSIGIVSATVVDCSTHGLSGGICAESGFEYTVDLDTVSGTVVEHANFGATGRGFELFVMDLLTEGTTNVFEINVPKDASVDFVSGSLTSTEGTTQTTATSVGTTSMALAGDGTTDIKFLEGITTTQVDLTLTSTGDVDGNNFPIEPAKAVPEFSSVGIIAAIVVIAAVGAVIVLKKKKTEE